MKRDNCEHRQTRADSVWQYAVSQVQIRFNAIQNEIDLYNFILTTPYEIKYSKMNICTYTLHTAVLFFSYIEETVVTRLSKQEIKIGTICKDYKNGNQSNL